MMDVKFNQPLETKVNKIAPTASSNSKNNFVVSKKGTSDFQKVFNDTKTKASEPKMDVDKSAKNGQVTSSVVEDKKETTGITVVEKPSFEKKEWAEELSENEQEKIKKAINLLLTFFENRFPEQKPELEEFTEELSAAEQEALVVLEQVTAEGKSDGLAQILSKELGVTIEKAQEILVNIKEPELVVVPKKDNIVVTPEKNMAPINAVVAPEKNMAPINAVVAPEKNMAPINAVVAPEKNMAPINAVVAPEKNMASINAVVAPEKNMAPINAVVVPEKNVAPINAVVAPEKNMAPINTVVAPENMQPLVTKITTEEKPMISTEEKSVMPNNQQNSEISALAKKEQLVIATQMASANQMSMNSKVDLAIDSQDHTVVSNVETKVVDQAPKNLVEKPVVLVDPRSVDTSTQIEKLSSIQMPALQSQANFIVGKLNGESLAKSEAKISFKEEKAAVNMVTTNISTQPTVSMMSLQTKLGQQFSDLQNRGKNDLELSIKPLQDSNQVKPTYADLFFQNKNKDVENVELNLLQDRAAISRQIVDNIKIMQKSNSTEMVIRLKPEHMGEMILRISTNAAGTVSASFQTNNPEARLALESTMLLLKQELAANGLKVQDVDLFGGISDFLSGQSQANKDQKSNHSSNKSLAEQEEKVENIMDKLGEQELTEDGNVDYRI